MASNAFGFWFTGRKLTRYKKSLEVIQGLGFGVYLTLRVQGYVGG